MRPRGQTPRMRCPADRSAGRRRRFNEAAGADPADAALIARRRSRPCSASMRPRGQTPRMRGIGPRSAARSHLRFNEAAGADPADAPAPPSRSPSGSASFNEAAGADPADAGDEVALAKNGLRLQ